jgi:hypothetical protein
MIGWVFCWCSVVYKVKIVLLGVLRVLFGVQCYHCDA